MRSTKNHGSMTRPAPILRYKCCGCIKHCKHVDKREYPTIYRSDRLYMQHLNNVKNATKIIDNKPPPLIINYLLRPDIAKQDLFRIQEIGIENKSLLSRIDTIMRSSGRTDNYNPKAGVRTSHLKEWFEFLQKTDQENKTIYQRIVSREPTIKTSYLLESWRKNLVKIRQTTRYPLILPGIMYSDDGLGLEDCLDQYRPRAYLNIAIRDGRSLGKIMIVLYSDIAPITTRNFMELIQNYERQKRAESLGEPQKYPHYTGSPVYRICRGLYIEMGDNTKQTGLGGASSFGVDFPQENFIQEATYPGMLAMVPDSEGNVNSKFLITVKPLKVLNGKRVIFGRVVQGMQCVEIMEKLSRPNGVPMEPIIIAKCGLLRPKEKITGLTQH